MKTCETCQEIQEERAAIHQFDGGCTRKEAEDLAWKERCSKHPLKIYQPPHGAMGEPLTGSLVSSARMKHGAGKIPVDGFKSFDSL